MSEQFNYNKIEDYLTGRLSKKELIAFENAVQQDKALATELALQKLEHDAMNRSLERDLQSKMKIWNTSPPTNPFQDTPVPPVPNKGYWMWFTIGLLGFISLAGIFWISKKNDIPPAIVPPTEQAPSPTLQDAPLEEKTEQTADPTHDVIPKEKRKKEKAKIPIAEKTPPKRSIPQNQPTTTNAVPKASEYQLLAMNTYQFNESFSSTVRTGTDATPPSNLEKAATAFDKKRYEEAQKWMVQVEHNQESIVKYLQGHIYFNLKDFQKAIVEFESVASSEWNHDYEAARWYLLLSYLTQLPEQKNNFEQLGQQIAEDEYSSFNNAAKKLLKAVGKIK